MQNMIDLGFLMRGEIIWDKAASASTSTAWGSWHSATNPTLRDTHEYILAFSQGRYRRAKMHGRQRPISKEQYLEITKSVGGFRSGAAKKGEHRVPYTRERP